MSTRPVELICKASGEFVAAQLHGALRVQDMLLLERSWASERARLMAELLRRGVDRREWPESLHWDWSRKAPDLQFLMAHGYGLVCQGEWQGAMLAKTVGYSAQAGLDRGKPLVYVDFVEAAPWNWTIRALGQAPRLKGIGTLLIRESIEQSLKEGFHGRVGLHALPQAEAFYGSTCGMTRIGPDDAKEGLVYFEFTRRQAQDFLSKGGRP